MSQCGFCLWLCLIWLTEATWYVTRWKWVTITCIWLYEPLLTLCDQVWLYGIFSIASTRVLFFVPAKCIDSYCEKRKADGSGGAVVSAKVLAEQEAIVNKMFERCFADKQWKQALGVAIETRRMDMFNRYITFTCSLFMLALFLLSLGCFLLMFSCFMFQLILVPHKINIKHGINMFSCALFYGSILVHVCRVIHMVAYYLLFTLNYEIILGPRHRPHFGGSSATSEFNVNKK